MKIKSIISMLAGVAMLFSLSSCFDLEETVYDKIPSDTFGKNKAEVEAIIGPVYNTLKKYFSSNWLYLSECTGDMAINPTRKGGDWFVICTCIHGLLRREHCVDAGMQRRIPSPPVT